MKSWKTTLLGVIIGVLTAYSQYVNHQLTTQNVINDLAIVGLGAAAKDTDK